MNLLVLILMFFSTSISAVTETDVQDIWETEIIPHFESLDRGSFVNKRNLEVYYYQRTERQNKKVLVILPGRTEAALYYSELIYDLRDSGFDIFIIDHQGQGRSDRMLQDRHKGHVFNFNDYVEDVRRLVDEVVIPQSQNKELYLLGHSMGGAIASLYLSQNPNVFKKAVLSAPMMQINTRPYREVDARRLALTLMKMRRATYYPPGMGPFDPDDYVYEGNNQTHSRARYNSIKSLLGNYADQAIGDPTVRWVFEALRVTQNIDRLGPQIKTPILILQPAKDQTVRPERQNLFCSKSINCQISRVPKAFHQPFLEVDSVRNRVINDVISFFN